MDTESLEAISENVPPRLGCKMRALSIGLDDFCLGLFEGRPFGELDKEEIAEADAALVEQFNEIVESALETEPAGEGE